MAGGSPAFSRLHAHQTNLVLFFRKKKDEKEPWGSVGEESSELSREALSSYKKRMSIEGMFSECEGQGFDPQSTRLRRSGKLWRLTLEVAML